MRKIQPDWHLPNQKDARFRDKAKSPVIFATALDDEALQLGLGKKAFISTYGCQANERDSESLAGLFEEMGFEMSNQPEEADVILLNTCGIRENAANNVLGEIGSYKRLFKKNPDLVVGVCGCMAQEEGFVEKLLERYPWVHLIFGTHTLQNLPDYLKKAMRGQKVVDVLSKQGEVVEGLPARRFSGFKGSVNIMYGCDKFCTYCIVPYTRGKQRSRSMEDVLEEVRTLQKLGYKEITLLGQNVNAYGKDLEEGNSFAALLEETAKTGIDRIRFMTSHPWDFSDEMIEVIAKYDNIMPAIHLPLQSGDDEILRRMNRRYTSAEYKDLFDRLKEKMPEASFSTDIIVGFPNESDEAFEKTLDMVRHCKFDTAFTFIFSPRPGTPAADMEDSIPLEVKKDRLNRLNVLWNDLALEKNKKLEGTVVKVLVDGPSKKDPNVLSGTTETGKHVNFRSDHHAAGDFADVKITEAKTFSLNGEPV